MTTATHHHIQIGDDSWCNWTGCQAGMDIMQKTGRITCDHPSQAAALRAAKALRPHFKRGRVKVIPGRCAHGMQA
jgi:hypothetical protein